MNKRRRRPAIQADPETLQWANGAARNQAARTAKQKRDAAREITRIKLDLPDQTIKEALATLAQELGTSTSQLATWFIVHGLINYHQTEPEIPMQPSRSPRITWQIDFQNALAKLAKALQ